MSLRVRISGNQIKYALLINREDCSGRISARGLDSTDGAQRDPYKKYRGRYSPIALKRLITRRKLLRSTATTRTGKTSRTSNT